MEQKKIIPFINAENEFADSVISLADRYSCQGADEIFLYNYTGDEDSQEEFLRTVRQAQKEIDVPFLIGMYVSRFEDAKKAFYTGASKLVIRKALLPDAEELDKIVERFGRDRLLIEVDMKVDFQTAEQLNSLYENGFGTVLLKHIKISPNFEKAISETEAQVVLRDGLIRNDLAELLSYEKVEAVSTNYFEEKDIHRAKSALKKEGICVAVFESAISPADFKWNEQGLIPAIVQDYRTGEVLMLGYMNETSFLKTLETGRMTYYSRSRQELWLKGETSGHFQYVKELSLDCDNDTILAKVRQIGAACHTGNRSCFFRKLARKDYIDTNPLLVLREDYDIIMERKEHPKKGSYTNYLFDKGIDKILKKCGEEATEMVIAAKNPDSEELKYEIADFLYHMMVLMAECGLGWDDISRELVNRR